MLGWDDLPTASRGAVGGGEEMTAPWYAGALNTTQQRGELPVGASSVLTHEQRERELQAADALARDMDLSALRIARARLADMLQEKWPEQTMERIRLRGEIVHSEISRRESSPESFLGGFR